MLIVFLLLCIAAAFSWRRWRPIAWACAIAAAVLLLLYFAGVVVSDQDVGAHALFPPAWS